MNFGYSEQDVRIDTAENSKELGQHLPSSLRNKLALKSTLKAQGGRHGDLFINKVYEHDPEVVQIVELLKRANKVDDTKYVTSEEISAIYNKNEKSNNSTSSIQRNIKEYFTIAARQKCSDVHFTVKENNSSLVEFRVLGDLTRFRDLSAEEGNAMCRTIYSTMCDVADKSFQPQRAQNGRIKQVYLPDEITGVRVATTPTENGYKMVCRLLYRAESSTNGKDSLESLGYEPFHVSQLLELKSKKSGVTIISGPTGSGKSTVLQTLISTIISETEGKLHVITVEDPPEYEIFGSYYVTYDEEVKDASGNTVRDENGAPVTKRVKTLYNKTATQTPVANAKGRDQRSEKFNDAIAAAMRLDPDVIMIGEVRDHSSAEAALRASMTGHQVWTTVHANNALTIFTRLFDIGVKKELACDANIVSGLIAQRLVKRLCPSCSLPYEGNEHLANTDTMKRLQEAMGAVSFKNVRLRNHSGCPECFKGIKGRTAIAEIIVLDDRFMQLTLNEDRVGLKAYWLGELKGVDMMMHAIIKIKRGLCDPHEIEGELGWLKVDQEIDRPHFEEILTGAESSVI